MARKKVFGHNAAIALGHRYSGKTRDPGERGGMPSKSVRSKNYKPLKRSELPLEVAMARKFYLNTAKKWMSESRAHFGKKTPHGKTGGMY